MLAHNFFMYVNVQISANLNIQVVLSAWTCEAAKYIFMSCLSSKVLPDSAEEKELFLCNLAATHPCTGVAMIIQGLFQVCVAFMLLAFSKGKGWDKGRVVLGGECSSVGCKVELQAMGRKEHGEPNHQKARRPVQLVLPKVGESVDCELGHFFLFFLCLC